MWNLTSSIQFAETYWECWLARGARIGATGGSDSHWLSTAAVQGVGNPTTWVFAHDRSRAGIPRALEPGARRSRASRPRRAARRCCSRPTVTATALRVDRRRHGAAGLADARGLRRCGRREGAGERTIFCWSRPSLRAPWSSSPRRTPRLGARRGCCPRPRPRKQAPGCEPNGSPVSTCAYDQLVAGITSPIYLGA